jgi:RecA/RadA recombinase
MAMKRSREKRDDNISRGLQRTARRKPLQGLLSTGIVPLNLAMSDTIHGGISEGEIINIVGDSQAGKSMLALSMLAELAITDKYSNYKIIYDDVEFAAKFDVGDLFGEALDERMVIKNSNTIQDYVAEMERLFKNKEKFIYVLDSLDSITTDEEIERFGKQLASKDSGKEENVLGKTMGMERAKYMSMLLRRFRGSLMQSNSFLIVVSQLRDNTDAANPFSPKDKRVGGRALQFYCAHVVWLYRQSFIKKKVDGKLIRIGSDVLAKVSKNKLTGKQRDVGINIYEDLGVDNTQAMIDLLLETNYWEKVNGRVKAAEFDTTLRANDLVQFIEDGNHEPKLAELCGEAWYLREEKLKLGRKRRY